MSEGSTILDRLLMDVYRIRGYSKRHDNYLKAIRHYRRERGIPRCSKPGCK